MVPLSDANRIAPHHQINTDVLPSLQLLVFKRGFLANAIHINIFTVDCQLEDNSTSTLNANIGLGKWQYITVFQANESQFVIFVRQNIF